MRAKLLEAVGKLRGDAGTARRLALMEPDHAVYLTGKAAAYDHAAELLESVLTVPEAYTFEGAYA